MLDSSSARQTSSSSEKPPQDPDSQEDNQEDNQHDSQESPEVPSSPPGPSHHKTRNQDDPNEFLYAAPSVFDNVRTWATDQIRGRQPGNGFVEYRTVEWADENQGNCSFGS